MKKSIAFLSPTFLLFLLFLDTNLLAQTNSDSVISTNTYSIPQVLDTLNISKSGYYLAEVKDLRPNSSNNGSITVDGIKNNLSFVNGLPLFLSSFIFPQNNIDNIGLMPISVQIEKLKCFASTNNKTDEGQLYIKLTFYDLNNAKVIRTFENTFNYKRNTQPDFISKLIFTSFKSAFFGLRNKELVEKKVSIQQISLSDENIYTIPLPTKKVIWSNPEYKILNVKDTRTYNRSEGTVSLGFFNRMATAKLDSSLVYYFTNSITTSDNESIKNPLTLQIKSFRISEEETALGEQGSVFFTASLVKDSIGNKYSIYTKTIAFDTVVDFDLTKAWPEIIHKVMDNFLISFNNAVKQEPTIITFDQKNDEIVAERFYYKHKYYWNGRELKTLNDFNEVIYKINDDALSKKFFTSINYIRTGRVLNYVGFTLLEYAFIDYLLVEDRSIKNWYRSTTYASNFTRLAGDKKILVWGGFASIVSSFILRKAGKSELLKAIGLYNKSLAEKVSLSFVPNIQNQGYLFQLNYTIGQR